MAGNISSEKIDLLIYGPMRPILENGFPDQFVVHSAETRADLGVVRLGIATRRGNIAIAVATMDQFKQAMLAAGSFGMPDPADGSTSSQHLVKVLQELGIADAMRSKTRYFKDGTQALQAVAQGKITLTIAPATSIRVVPGVQLVGLLPASLQSVTLYSAALSRESAKSGGSAGALLGMLRSQEFAALMRDRGIDPP
jgi:molybdate transport system substrate-binding protein